MATTTAGDQISWSDIYSQRISDVYGPGSIIRTTPTTSSTSTILHSTTPPPISIRDRIARGDFPHLNENIPEAVLDAIESKEASVEALRMALEAEEKVLRSLYVLYNIEQPK